MDVRCERCRAQYVFDDEQVTPSGLTVQCTHCGHVFRVKKKELVVTVPVKPEELDGPPLPATAAAPRAGGGAGPSPSQPEGPREWRVRQASGNLFTFRELTTLQKWIVEQKVVRDDEISASGDASWRRLGDIAELATFFQVVEAAERGRRQPPPPAPPAPTLRWEAGMDPGTGIPAVPSTSAVASPSPPEPPPPSTPPVPERSSVSIEVELEPDDLAAVRKGRSGRLVLALGALAVAAGAGVYLYAPRIFPARAPGPEPVAIPLTIELGPGRPPGAPSSAAGASAPGAGERAQPDAGGGEAKAEAPPDGPSPLPPLPAPEPGAVRVAAPIPVVEPAAPSLTPPQPLAAAASAPPRPPPAPPGPRALLAQATRLRERGEIDGALALYGRAVELDPRNVAALTGRGLCYLDLETYPPAEASFEAALRVRPDDADALLGLAETYRWQGKRANAIRYYERYLASHPAGEEANVARNALEELRK